jgi:hypothetical protein
MKTDVHIPNKYIKIHRFNNRFSKTLQDPSNESQTLLLGGVSRSMLLPRFTLSALFTLFRGLQPRVANCSGFPRMSWFSDQLSHVLAIPYPGRKCPGFQHNWIAGIILMIK